MLAIAIIAVGASVATAQPPGPPPPGLGPPPVLPGPPPTHADLDYAPAEPADSNGHKLDLYSPPDVDQAIPGRDLDGRLGMDGRYRQAPRRLGWPPS